MLAASMAVGHLLTATEREPPRPPHRLQARAPLGNIRLALSQLAWTHLKAVVLRPARASSAQSRALAIDTSAGDITGAIAVQRDGHLPSGMIEFDGIVPAFLMLVALVDLGCSSREEACN